MKVKDFMDAHRVGAGPEGTLHALARPPAKRRMPCGLAMDTDGASGSAAAPANRGWRQRLRRRRGDVDGALHGRRLAAAWCQRWLAPEASDVPV